MEAEIIQSQTIHREVRLFDNTGAVFVGRFWIEKEWGAQVYVWGNRYFIQTVFGSYGVTWLAYNEAVGEALADDAVNTEAYGI